MGKLGALVPEGKTRANNLTDHKKDKEQLKEKGLGLVLFGRKSVCLFFLLSKQNNQTNRLLGGGGGGKSFASLRQSL